ncbi:class I lanthipeptide [Chitinophaga oryzae]|uniref:Class I lanthipeptide n=1 Tax=Chitinophaga oryzae TaxID=2725414 RepID=A0AAE6ZGK4_9BACT|nr:class I lanthipeptide [Chitinophaga oryzae]QJB31822.1 class I lanthipeptide [Chitinophaga oryzae]
MKKKIAISKKLSFNKEAVAVLNPTQQRSLAGGKAFETSPYNCATLYITCETSPGTGQTCWLCE